MSGSVGVGAVGADEGSAEVGDTESAADLGQDALVGVALDVVGVARGVQVVDAAADRSGRCVALQLPIGSLSPLSRVMSMATSCAISSKRL